MMKKFLVIFFCLQIQASADDSSASRFGIVHEEGRALELIDGKLFLCVAISDDPAPNARRYESRSDIFDVQTTEKGYLLRLRPGLINKQGRRNLDLDNYYLTADYSETIPSIRFTKVPEKYSYWEVPEIGGYLALHPNPKAGPILNKNDLDKTVYLGTSREFESLRHPLVKGHVQYSRVCLSYEHTDDFNVQRLNSKDEGK